MRKDNYYTSVPDGYEVVKIIDAKDKRTAIWMNVASCLLTLGTLACFLPLLSKYSDGMKNFNVLAYVLFLVGMFAYIVLHELTHGLFYKLYTGEKLTFGFAKTVAYCGVPNLFVKKRPMVVTTLAPFVTFIFVFGIPLFFLQDFYYVLLFALFFAVHVGGCVGDLYDAILLTFKYNERETIINDTGPTQTIYQKKK